MGKSPPPGSGSGSDSDDSSGSDVSPYPKMKPWHCKVCTFLNKQLETECEMCLTRRERPAKRAPNPYTELSDQGKKKPSSYDEDRHKQKKSVTKDSGKGKKDRERFRDRRNDSDDDGDESVEERPKKEKRPKHADDSSPERKKQKNRDREEGREGKGGKKDHVSSKEKGQKGGEEKEKRKDRDRDSGKQRKERDGERHREEGKSQKKRETTPKGDGERETEPKIPKHDRSSTTITLKIPSANANLGQNDGGGGGGSVKQEAGIEDVKSDKRAQSQSHDRDRDRDRQTSGKDASANSKTNLVRKMSISSSVSGRVSPSNSVANTPRAGTPVESFSRQPPNGISHHADQPLKRSLSISQIEKEESKKQREQTQTQTQTGSSQIDLGPGPNRVKIGDVWIRVEDLDGDPPTLLVAKREGRKLTLQERMKAFAEKKAMANEKAKRSLNIKIRLPNGMDEKIKSTEEIIVPQAPPAPVKEVKEEPKSEIAETGGPIKRPQPCEPTEEGDSAKRKKLSEPPESQSPVPPPAIDMPNQRMLEALGGTWVRLRENVYIETHPNGGASVVHVFLDESYDQLDSYTQSKFVQFCVEEILSEREGYPTHVMGIIHGAIRSMPNILRYLVQHNPNLPVVMEDLHTGAGSAVSIGQYAEMLDRSFHHGTAQVGPMRNISLVGTVQEETGGYFKDVINIMRSNEFVKNTLPWGYLSANYCMPPDQSDDGPILWTRPGEQVIRLGSDGKTRRDDDSGTYRIRAHSAREKLITDRTNSHADFAGHLPNRQPVAAVGLLQSCDKNPDAPPIVCKNVVAFHGKDMEEVQKFCNLDFNEEPMDQTVDKQFWIGDGKLNQLRRNGILYARAQLMVGDLYYIPRKIVHQFQTVASCSSIAWHLRYKKYKEFTDPPSKNP